MEGAAAAIAGDFAARCRHCLFPTREESGKWFHTTGPVLRIMIAH